MMTPSQVVPKRNTLTLVEALSKIVAPHPFPVHPIAGISGLLKSYASAMTEITNVFLRASGEVEVEDWRNARKSTREAFRLLHVFASGIDSTLKSLATAEKGWPVFQARVERFMDEANNC